MDERDSQRADALVRQAQVRRIVFGAMFIAGGLMLLFDRRSIFDVFGLWPLLLVGLGLARILGGCCARERRGGIWLLAIGLWFALNEFTHLGYHGTWPLLLVAVGGLIVWDAVAPGDRCPICAEGHHAG